MTGCSFWSGVAQSAIGSGGPLLILVTWLVTKRGSKEGAREAEREERRAGPPEPPAEPSEDKVREEMAKLRRTEL